MKKKIEAIAKIPSNNIYGYMVEPYQVDNLIGKMLTFAESLGFNESREKATKDIIRNMLYDALFNDSAFVEGEDVIKIHSKNRAHKVQIYTDTIVE